MYGYDYPAVPPRSPQARKHGKSNAEIESPSCPSQGRLREENPTGHHNVTTMSDKYCNFNQNPYVLASLALRNSALSNKPPIELA